MNSTTRWSRAAVAALVLGLSVQAAPAQDVERFYAGRKLSVVVGHEVGTGFDLYGRALARHMGRFIPGKPNLVPENMIGVAGFAAANWLYNVAAKDGSVIAIFAHTAPFEPLLGKGTGRFDASKFTWIGNMDAVVGVCGVWDHAGIAKFDDLFTKETVFGAGGAGSGGPLTQFPTALRRLLGVKIKLIQGYKGSAEIRLATGARRAAGRLRHPGLDLEDGMERRLQHRPLQDHSPARPRPSSGARRHPACLRLHQDARKTVRSST